MVLSRLLRANVNDLISRAEDPGMIIDQALRDMRGAYSEARSEVADALAQAAKLEREANTNRTLASEYEKKAEEALRESEEYLRITAALSPRIAKIAFTGETTTGRLIMQYASQNLIPVTLELGGKSANIFFEDVARDRDAYYDKALEGFTFFALNQGEVCTCPSRALIQRSIYEEFLGDGLERVGKIVQGNPLDTETMRGAQASQEQMDKITEYLKIGPEEGAETLTGGHVNKVEGLENGYYIEPTVFKGTNDMRIFREEIFGPVQVMMPFADEAEALRIANGTDYGLVAGIWTRDMNTAYRVGRSIEAGRVWTNCYHIYPAHAAFGGYKQSGNGREMGLAGFEEYLETKTIATAIN